MVMEVKFRVEVLPNELRILDPFLVENHRALAQLRVDDGVSSSSETVKDRFRSTVSPLWTKEANSEATRWLKTVEESKVDCRYEAWVLRSLWFVMNPNVSLSIRGGSNKGNLVLPHQLHYLEKEALEANLGSEQDAIAFASNATEIQRARMIEVAEKMLSRGHSKDVYAFLKENSIVTSESSRLIYWYLGAMDYSGITFD